MTTYSSLKGKKVLVVDDEKDLCELMQMMLNAYGIDVVSSYNGEEALVHLKKDSFDAVISDLKMPVLDGVGLLKKIRELPKDQPNFIFLTGSTEVVPPAGGEQRELKIFHKPVVLKSILNELKKIEPIVLFIDDNPARQKMTAEKLALKKLRLHVASQVGEAEDLISRLTIDCILIQADTDLENFRNFISSLSVLSRKIPVFAIIPKDPLGSFLTYFANSLTAVMSDPLDPDDFEKKLRDYIDKFYD